MKNLKGKIPIEIFETADLAFEAMANDMVNEIINNNQQKLKTLFIIPVGPVGQYPYFVQKVNEEMISLKDVTFINMDDYMVNETKMVTLDHPLSFRQFMNEKVYQLINPDLIMDESQRIFPTPTNRELIENIIEAHGGVDVCYGGIGINGHVAFNEPPEEDDHTSLAEFINTSVRVLKIARETLVVNSLNELDGAYYLMPKFCVTVGMKQILNSKKVRLYCFRPWHRSVVKRAIEDDSSPAFPVTLLQSHPNALITISKNIWIG